MTKMQKRKNERIWEIDALRGHLILWILFFHLYVTVCKFCIDGIYGAIDPVLFAQRTDPLHFFYVIQDGTVSRGFFQKAYQLLQPQGVDVFFVVSGISCMFSRSNLKSGIRLLIAAYAVSLFTYLVSIWRGEPSVFIRFGALQCYAYCHLIYSFLLEKRSNKITLIAAIFSLIIGYYLHYNPISIQSPFLVPFGITDRGILWNDYWPIFPMLGWFLLGVLLGRKYYAQKRTLIPLPKFNHITRPLQWLGRYSGVIYVSHIVLYTIVFCGIGYVFNLY